MGTRGNWARDLAIALGNNNPSAETIRFISAWTVGEGTKATYNPLATTYDLPPNTPFNSVNVRNFQSRSQGIQATVKTLMGNHRGYEDIREGIRTNDAQRAMNGLMVAPWGTNGTHVQTVYNSKRNIENEDLLSEPTGGSGGDGVGGGTSGFGSIEPSENKRPNTISMPVSNTELDDTTRIGYFLFGVGLLLTAGLIAFRSFIPTAGSSELAQLAKAVVKA